MESFAVANREIVIVITVVVVLMSRIQVSPICRMSGKQEYCCDHPRRAEDIVCCTLKRKYHFDENFFAIFKTSCEPNDETFFKMTIFPFWCISHILSDGDFIAPQTDYVVTMSFRQNKPFTLQCQLLLDKLFIEIQALYHRNIHQNDVATVCVEYSCKQRSKLPFII